MNEIWRPIKGFETLYEVSNKGRIRSLCGRYGNLRIVKLGHGSRGYMNVCLCDHGKQTTRNVHRIVAETFIPNPDNLPCVNHKDEDKTNNDVSNLEWCSYYYNNTYGDRLTKSAIKRGKPVKCVETGETYASGRAAQRATGIKQGDISNCCNGKRITAGGFHWEFV